MKDRVLIESPYLGDVETNVNYARSCMWDSLERGEAPMVGHLLYTQVLDDRILLEKALGIATHISWISAVDKVVVYKDLGISFGMSLSIKAAEKKGVVVEYRALPVTVGWEWRCHTQIPPKPEPPPNRVIQESDQKRLPRKV